MIKKKQLFKEDKLYRGRKEIIESDSNEEKELKRGRQMTSTDITANKKNKSSTCESKGKPKGRLDNFSKRTKLIKRIHNQSPSSSIDSGSGELRFCKKETKPIDNSLGSDDDSYKSSGYYEENLLNEIERILMEIINNHMNLDSRKNEKDVEKFQTHVILEII
jgi:hypothetical protein